MKQGSGKFIEIMNSETLSIIVNPNSSRNEIIGYNDEKKAWAISIKAAAEKGKANKELLSFMKKATGRKWAIKSGSHSKNKMLERID